MGDDVVELTSDACALIDRGLPHALVAVALQLRGAGRNSRASIRRLRNARPTASGSSPNSAALASIARPPMVASSGSIDEHAQQSGQEEAAVSPDGEGR